MATLGPDEVRRRILIAMVSDDELLNMLVLKGGNALAMVHGVVQRATLDMDFSIASHFPDLAGAKARIFAALRGEFAKIGFAVFDEKFIPKPSARGPNQPDWWGGYVVEFKLIELAIFNENSDADKLRRLASVVGPQQKKTYSIDISKNEYCAGKVKREIDSHAVYVYSLEMIAIEKFRAICQQLPAYAITRNKTPRARDFYDIHEIVTRSDVDLFASHNQELFREIFAAKGVPLELLSEICTSKDFHALDWPSVEASIAGSHEDFDYYFNYVCEYVRALDSIGKK